jgi:glycosyltransferase involved in cell wall biosynthesis
MPDSTPLVSVIIPCYNATRFIPETLDSLRAQVFRDFEVILVNDGCPDTENLERALEPYNAGIRYLKSGRWASISGSRNTGIMASQARYIALLDADDKWEPDYLRVLVGILEQNPSIDLVCPNARYFGETEWTDQTFFERNPSEGNVTMESLISRRTTLFVGVTARRESLIRAGMFDPQIRGGEDWDLWLRVCRTGGKIVLHREPLACYRVRKGSMSADVLDLIRNSLSVCEKHLNLPETTEEEKRWWEDCRTNYFASRDLVLGKQALYGRRTAEAIGLLSKANKVLKQPRLRIAILALRVAPDLLYWHVHRKYSTEYAYLH